MRVKRECRRVGVATNGKSGSARMQGAWPRRGRRDASGGSAGVRTEKMKMDEEMDRVDGLWRG